MLINKINYSQDTFAVSWFGKATRNVYTVLIDELSRVGQISASIQ